MSRLTEKLKNGNYICGIIKGGFVDKLGQLEDLEEELGCPLDVLFKALKNGIYHNEKFEHPVLILDEDSFKENNLSLLVVGTIVYLKDYKKTWWLKKDKSE